VRGDEVGALLLSFGYFFCLLCGYYVLRPIRDEMGISRGVDKLPVLFTGTFMGERARERGLARARGVPRPRAATARRRGSLERGDVLIVRPCQFPLRRVREDPSRQGRSDP
jgi:hypothetical protein